MKDVTGNGLLNRSLAFLLTWSALPLYYVFANHSYSVARLSSDLITGLGVAFIMLCLTKMLSVWPRVATFLAVTFYSLALAAAIVVEYYFFTTGQNLGADLLGYSAYDVFETAAASGIEFKILVYAMAVFSSFGILIFVFNKMVHHNRQSTVVAFLIGALGFSVSSYHVINATHTEDENKILYLITDIKKSGNEATDHVATSGFPFLHDVTYQNPWKGYITRTDSLPNFVFILVEGLGADFMREGSYAGFTPFLDSLSNESLYWKNGLSNAGRTFGVVPSVLGSLPYGDNGFMNLGEEMPFHQTLFTLLKAKGYRTNFFYGGNPNFDNLDLFLQRQNLDQFINSSNFPSSVEETKSNKQWGYKDDQLFAVGTQAIKTERGPRVDCYLTLSTHEPFECPDQNIKKIADHQIKGRGGEFAAHANIFECLRYTDQSLRMLFRRYAERPDFNRTIFIITGDHRLIPMESGNPLSRHHVPILVYSPMMTKPHVFSSLAIHSSITPSVLGYLAEEYQLNFPKRMPFISTALSTRSNFDSDLDLPLIRVKNRVNEYISGKYFLSNDKLYRIDANLELTDVNDEALSQTLKSKLAQFQGNSRFAFANNKLDSGNATFKAEFSVGKLESNEQEKFFAMNPDEKFETAKTLARNKKYEQSRTVLKVLLNQSPNQHDARLLLARTYGWQSKFDSAMYQVRETLKKSPEYADAFVAWSDIEFWQGHFKASLDAADQGLHKNPSDAELLQRKARIANILSHQQSKGN